MMLANKKRILWLDNLRGFLILIVVLGHVLQYYASSETSIRIYNYIYCFHMPLFMLLSGFASFKPIFDQSLIIKRAKQLLPPYVIWTLLECIFTKNNLLDALFFHPKYWFLLVLFMASCLHYVLFKLIPRSRKGRLLLLSVIIGILYLLPKITKIDFLAINVWAFFFFFFEFGSFVREIDLHLNNRLMGMILSISVPIFVLLGYYYRQGFSPIGIFPPSFYFVLSGMIGSVLFMTLFKLLFDFESWMLVNLGKMTLGIYVIHCFIRSLVDSLFPDLVNGCERDEIVVPLLFISFSIISIFLTWNLSRNKYTKFVVGL